MTEPGFFKEKYGLSARKKCPKWQRRFLNFLENLSLDFSENVLYVLLFFLTSILQKVLV